MKYLAFIGYDIPEALEVKIEVIMPLLDKHFKRIEDSNDQVHVINGESHISFINDILEAYNKLYDFNLTLDLEDYDEEEEEEEQYTCHYCRDSGCVHCPPNMQGLD